MQLTVVGLGNPGSEYETSRHNTGRIVLETIAKRAKAEWKRDMKLNAQVATVSLGVSTIKLVAPDTFMNNSGNAVAPLIKTPKDLEKLVVVYDDLDLPIGTIKISYNRSAGGHNGLASIIKRVKSEKFWRIRVGIAPVTPSGKIKKLVPNKKGTPFLMANFSATEESELKKITKEVEQILIVMARDGGVQAMNEFNTK